MADKTICTPMKQEYFAKLKWPIAATKMLNHEKKEKCTPFKPDKTICYLILSNKSTSAYRACLPKQSAIQKVTNILKSSKLQLPRAKFSVKKIKQNKPFMFNKQTAIQLKQK